MIRQLRAKETQRLIQSVRAASGDHKGGTKVGTREASSTIQPVQAQLLNQVADEKHYDELVQGYRQWGYLHADTSPFGIPRVTSPLTDILANFTINTEYSTLKGALDTVYCGSLGVQYMYIPDTEKQAFLTHLIENKPRLSKEELLSVNKTLLRCENLDKFLGNKFSNLKQYGGEGAEGTVAFCQTLLALCPENKVDEVVIAIAHRGRISLMTELLELPYQRLLKKYSGQSEFHPEERSIGDVISHLWQSVDLAQPSGGTVHVTMLPNPSHLENANSVALGKVRAKRANKASGRGESSPLALLIHGDAAFAGQGVSFENAQMSRLPGYSTDGSIHLITNNLIGFTAENNSQRSTFTAGDLGKMYDVPVICVNGLDIAAINHAVHIAAKWRAEYREDIIIDLQCYRLYGHNQHDEPRFTNPLMYQTISGLSPLQDRITSSLLLDGLVHESYQNDIIEEHNVELNSAYKNCLSYTPPKMCFTNNWAGMRQAEQTLTTWDTGYDIEDIRTIGTKSVIFPEGFSHHPTLNRAHLNKRNKMMETGEGIDWAMGEALAMGSLLLQGYNVRLSGEDVTRGTFSNRHVTVYDQTTEEPFTALNHMLPGQQGKVEAVNSFLSEEGVVGFEYGYSLENPNTLVLWEAQFGDFFNPAQVIYDQFVASGEAKWVLQSGLVSLLPHGHDGNGPDHTSARLERWLTLSDSKECTADTDDVNIQVVNCTTPAQYFHLLRRQMIRPYRKPLILMSPKALLRSPDAVSNISELGRGSHFQRVIGDAEISPSNAKRVLLCSGKHYYSLKKQREELKDDSTAIIRIEELCPFPSAELQMEINKYPGAELCWAQEEQRNGGAWSFVHPRVRNILGHELTYAGRAECAAAAVGVSQVHAQEVKQILDLAFSHLA